jgi:transglutaminase-like putative cysteine protease
VSGAPASSLALPRALEGGRSITGPTASPAPATRSGGPLIVRLVTFAALVTYAATGWLALVADRPWGRVMLAIGVLIAAAALLGWLETRATRPVAWGASLAVALTATAAACIAMGLPVRLLVPAGWGELGDRLGTSLGAISGLNYPYRGGAEWSRLVILLGLSVGLGLATALAFWPSRRGARALRTTALILVVAMYAVGATVSAPGAPLIHGLVLLLLAAAWIWLPGLGRREATASAALVLAAGALALPLAGALDGNRPWLDYRSWTWSSPAVGTGESFAWNHSYGPLNWTRTGESMFKVQSEAPHYWRAAVLDRFDGYRWLQSTASGSSFVELPQRASGSSVTPQPARLNPAWIHQLTFTISGLRSQLVVGAGTALGVRGLEGVTQIQGGLAMPSDQSLVTGDSYTVRAYIPDPSTTQMRTSPPRYPGALAPYTQILLPRPRVFGSNRHASRSRGSAAASGPLVQLAVPFWGTRESAMAGRALSQSAYGGVYRLARRVTAGARTPFDAVQRLERYLRMHYTYSEIPPRRQLPLRAFLLRDRIGYCQQFSGAMALMLRMVGVPARVASGFSPGTSSQPGTYVVRDFDAHSWVEVYFSGIGWVPFDPTPGVAPARSQATGLRPPSPSLAPGGSRHSAKQPADLSRGRSAQPATRPSGSGLWLAPLAAALLAVGGIVAFGLRALRNRSVPPGELAEAQLRELASAIGRLGSRAPSGATLLGLERRLRLVGGPASSTYAAKLRAARYAPRNQEAPTFAERRALRRELTAGRGLRGRLRGLTAIPPGGPVGLRGSRS